MAVSLSLNPLLLAPDLVLVFMFHRSGHSIREYKSFSIILSFLLMMDIIVTFKQLFTVYLHIYLCL